MLAQKLVGNSKSLESLEQKFVEKSRSLKEAEIVENYKF